MQLEQALLVHGLGLAQSQVLAGRRVAGTVRLRECLSDDRVCCALCFFVLRTPIGHGCTGYQLLLLLLLLLLRTESLRLGVRFSEFRI